jgi:hypothetical protein
MNMPAVSRELRRALQQYVFQQLHRLRHAEGYVCRASAGFLGRPGPELEGGKRTAEEPPPAGHMTRITCGLPTNWSRASSFHNFIIFYQHRLLLHKKRSNVTL